MPWTEEKLKAHYVKMLSQWNEIGKVAQGRNELLAHFKGEYLSKNDAIKAHCYECMGGYADEGLRDCENPPCPLYPYHPFNNERVKTKSLGNRNFLIRKPLNSVTTGEI